MTRFLSPVFLFIALFISKVSFAQTTSHAPIPALTKLKMSEAVGTTGLRTTGVSPAANRGPLPVSQAISGIQLGSSGNIYGLAFGPRTNLYADPNTNSVMMVYRIPPATGGSLGYSYSTNGGSSFTISTSPLYTPNATLGRSNARFPQGSIYNPTGNTTASATFANFFAPSLAGLVSSGWGGLVHGAKPLTSGSAIAAQENRNSFLIPDGGALNPADNSFWISSGLYDPNGVYKDSILLGKGVWTSGQYQYTYTNLYFPIETAPDLTKRFEATNIAWGYNGTGYLAVLCHESFNAVTVNNYYPVIFKTIDSGATWNKIAAIDMYSFSGRYQTAAAYSTGFDLDLAVDANNNLHLFTAVLPVGSSPFTVSDTPGQWGMYDIHTTDGGTTWNAFQVASPQSFKGEFSDTQVLFEYNRPQISKTWNGNRLFYVWFDSDTAGTGARFNNYPNAIVAGLNISSGLMMSDSNSTAGSIFGDLCYFGNVSPYTLTSSALGCHKIPVSIAEFTAGTINSTITNYYLNGIEFCSSLFNTAPDSISLTNLNLWASNINGPSTVCQNSTGVYSVSPMPGATNYVWSVPTGSSIINGQGDTAVTVQFGLNSGIVTVKAYNNGALIGSANIPFASQPISIVASANTGFICSGGSGATLTAAGGISYSWSPATGLSSTTGSSVVANPTTSTIYTVTGTASNGCTNTRNIVINVLDAPSVSIGALDTTAFCLGDSVVLLARSPDATSYNWIRNGLSITNAQDTLYTARQTGNYRAIVTNSNGCTALSSIITVTVYIPTQITVTYNPSSQYCDSGLVSLSGNGGVSYTWSDSITDGIPFTIFTTDTFTVIGTDINGCRDTATATVVVSQKPNVDASDYVTICRGRSTVLNATGALNYSWSPTNGLGGVSTGDSVVAAPITTTLYTVTGSNGAGCSKTDTVTVFVIPAPSVNISGDSIICPGASATLTALGAANFTWTPSAGLNTITGATVIASPDSTRTYTVVGTAGNGCTNSSSVTVQIRQRPAIGFNASPGLVICSGDSLILSGSGGVSYSWTGNISNGIAFSLDSNATFTVTGTDSVGCTNSDTATIQVLDLPTVNASGYVTLCRGNSTILTANGGLTYSWTPTTGLGGVSTGDSVTASPVVTTIYTVTGTDSSGCRSTDTVTVFINPRPNIVISGNDTICPGTSSALTANGAATYSWSPSIGLNSTALPNVSATPDSTVTYTVIGTSNLGCTNSSTFRLYVYARPQIGINAFPAFEFCGPDTITLSGTGATSYSWSGGINNGAPFYLDTTTTFTVTGTDLNGCTGTASIIAGVNSTPVINITGPSLLCIGDSTTLSASGATSYTWNPSIGLSADTGTVVKASPSSSTTYTVVGNNGCIDSTTFNLAVNSLPQVSAGPDKSICLGKNVTVTASGASSYSWSPSTGLNTTNGATVIASPTDTTDYIVAGIDSNGCRNTDTIRVAVRSLPVIGYSANPSDQLCGGDTVTLNGTGGVSYSWSGGVINGQPVVVNGTTTYTVTGTGPNGCTNTATALISVNSVPNVVINGTKTICINDSTTLTATGASSYSWSPSTGLSATTGAIVKASPNVTTTYTVIGDNGCIDSTLVTVTVRTRPNLVISGNDSICEGKSTVLTATGGSVFQWSPSTGLNRTDSAVVIASPVVTTTYSVISTGANGCTSVSNFTVTVNTLPSITAAGDTTICRGKNANISVSGANTYLWSPSTGLNAVNLATVSASPNTTTSYIVIGTNTNGCTDTDTVEVIVNQLPPVNVGSDKAICIGSSTALSVTGAQSFQWSPTTGLSNSTGPSVTASPLTTTNYFVTGTDANGCTQTDTIKVTVNLLPNVSTGPDTSVCLGSSTTLTANGADSTYTWSPATGLSSVSGSSIVASPASTTTYIVTGTNRTGCSNTSTVTVTVNSLPEVSAGIDRFICLGDTTTLNASGASTYVWAPTTGLSLGTGPGVLAFPSTSRTYIVTGADSNGCTNNDTVLVTVFQLPPVNAGADKAICEAGSTALTATGAQSYLWSPTSGLSSSFGPTVIASPFTTTTYFVVGTDGNGCKQRDTVKVTVNQPPIIFAGPGSSICPGDSVALSASGADSLYSWSPSTGLSNATGANVTASPVATTTYTVTGTNTTGCTGTFSFTVTIRSIPNVTAGNDQFICLGDTVSLNATNGTSYSWSPSTGLSSTSGSTILANPVVNTAYVVIGTGTTGCTASDTVNVTVWSIPTVQAGPDDSICRGDTITLTASGASTYTWSPSLGLGSTTGATVLAFPTVTRTYVVTGRDSNNCKDRDTVTIQVFSLPPVNAGNDVDICIGDSVALSSSGAVNYTWSPANGLSSSTGNPVMASPSVTTTYQITGTDVNGCIDTSEIIVNVNLLPLVTASALPNDTLCANALLSLSGSGASTYQWSSSVQNGTPFLAGIGGIYTVIGTDTNGCTGLDSISIVTLTAPSPTIISGPTLVLAGSAYTYYSTIPSTFNLNWSTSSGTILSGQGTDTVTIQWDTSSTHILVLIQSDQNGCSDTTTLVVTTNPGTGLIENRDNEFQVYPNPVSTTVHLLFKDEKMRWVRISDMRGRIISEQRVHGIKSRMDIPSQLQSGMYLIEVGDGIHPTLVRRLMIERGRD